MGTSVRSQLRELLAVRLARKDDRPGAHVAVWGDKARHAAGFVIGDGGLLVDRAAAPLDRSRQTTRQSRRVDAGAGRVEESGDRVGDAHALGNLVGIEQLVAIGQSQRLQAAIGALDARALVLTARQPQRPAPRPLRVDLLLGDDALDLIDGLVHGARRRRAPPPCRSARAATSADTGNPG